jgi:hypothetical protein
MAMTNLFDHTFFINLDNRVDRLVQVRSELMSWGISNPERFNAVSMPNGAVGCTISHIKCLEIAKERNYSQVFICEDDIHCVDVPKLREQIASFNAAEDTWDVLLIGGNNAPPYRVINDGLMQVYNCQTTTGYIVKRHYYHKLIANFREGVKELMRNPKNHREFALDMYWKRLQKEDRWLMMLPLTVTQRPSYSNVEGREVDYSRAMLDHEKKWLQTQMRPMYYVDKALPVER